MTQRPSKKWGRREYFGGVATLVFVFGIVTFLLGSANPWGVQQILGLIAAILGLMLMFVRLWLRPPPG
jgi:hypothetical protein